MKKSIALLFLFVACFTAQSAWTQEQKIIKGKITYESKVLANVHVVNATSKVLTKSDDQGNYEIPAKVGDEITYSFVGLKTMTIIVEDVTSILNIKMTEDVNQLEDIVIKAKVYENKPEIIPIQEAVNMQFRDPDGKFIKPARSRGVVHYLDNDDTKRLPSGLSLELALNRKFLNVTRGQNRFGQDVVMLRGVPAVIDIDGDFYDTPPAIEFSDVVQMYIMMAEKLIIIRTKNHPDFIKRQKERVAETYRNQNRYDANTVTTELDFSQNDLPVNWLMYTPHTVPDSEFKIIIDNENFIEGRQSLKFDVKRCQTTGGWYSPGFTNQFHEVGRFKGEASYEVKFWIMNDGTRFRINAGGVNAFEGEMNTVLEDDEDISEWKMVEFTIDVPKEMELRLELKGE